MTPWRQMSSVGGVPATTQLHPLAPSGSAEVASVSPSSTQFNKSAVEKTERSVSKRGVGVKRPLPGRTDTVYLPILR